MPRVASLYLSHLAIERMRRAERTASQPGRTIKPPDAGRLLPARSGHWRPGARWAREMPAGEVALRDGTGALVTAHRDGNRMVLAAVSPQAQALGLQPGMPLTQARVLVSGLDVRDADPDGDAAWLRRLGLFAARRWTPRAAVSGPDGLWLDLTGVAHLFGGEEQMGARILAFCRRLGFTARIAIAGTPGASHALARYGDRPLILCPPGGEAEAIADFPIAALRLDKDVLDAARRLGIERIGELIAKPRAPLQRRFGRALLTRLDQALGRMREPFDLIVPEAPPSVLLRFLEPIATPEAIEEALGEAMRRLVPLLEESGYGVRRLGLSCDRVDGEVQQAVIGTARATRDGAHLLRLMAGRIETLEPGFGLENLRLVALRVEPLEPETLDGLGTQQEESDLAGLIDRLAVRLGRGRLYRMSALESDLPERSVTHIDPLAQPASWPKWPRPARLIVPPERVDQVMSALPDGPPRRFKWRGQDYRVATADGPERVYGEWWRRAGERETVRDYFQVEANDGARFWLFREGDGENPATGNHCWRLHGIFA